MKTKNIKFITIFLVLLLCLMGAASAADNTTTNTVDATLDEQNTPTDTVTEDTNKKTVSTQPTKTVTDDTPKEKITTTDNTTKKETVVKGENKKSETKEPKTLKMSKDDNILGDFENHDVIYVNVSSSNDGLSDDVHGSSWDDAYGGDMGSVIAFACINEGGTIYFADGTYTDVSTSTGNITVIGLENTIFDTCEFMSQSSFYMGEHYSSKYINITFKNPAITLCNGHEFINCTFINPIIKTNEEIYNTDRDTHGQNTANIEESFAITFTNCEFKDYDIKGSLLEAFKFSIINFNNCTFENITANSIVNNTGGFTLQDSINFDSCTFTDVNVKGLVDVPVNTITGPEEGSRVLIEDCIGITSGNSTIGDRTYVNSTKSRIKTSLTGQLDDENNFVITLKDTEGNTITDADADILIKINDEESYPDELTNGICTISNSELTSRKGNITIIFEETSAYKGSTSTIEYFILNKTQIYADNLSTEVNVAKNLTVTLKDVNGDLLADKNITVSVNNKNDTICTNATGEAIIPIQYNTAGIHTYTLIFNGDETYKNSTKTVTVTITEPPLTNTTLTITNTTDSIIITLTTKDENTPIKDATIKYNITGKDPNQTGTTDANGQITISNLEGAGDVTITATYEGDDTYNKTTQTANYNFPTVTPPTPTLTNTTLTITNTTDSIIITLTTKDENTPIKDATIKYNITSQDPNQTGTTDANGQITISNLEGAGDVTITATYEGDDTYNKTTQTANYNFPTVTPPTPVKVDPKFDIVINNVEEGNPITVNVNANNTFNGDVEVKITGNTNKTVKVTLTNGAGSTSVADLTNGQYTASINFPGNANFNAENKTISFNITKKAEPITPGNGSGNKTPETPSNPNQGQQQPSTSGSSSSTSTANQVTLTPTKAIPKTISKKAKKLVLSTKLKVGNKIAKKKKVIFIVKGKKYTRKTNSKGVAKLTLKKKQLAQLLKKVKAGKKIKVQIKYGKKTITKYIKIKK